MLFNSRTATTADLDAINQVIESAVTTWQLPLRVKRLSLPNLHYTLLDFTDFEIIIAENTAKK